MQNWHHVVRCAFVCVVAVVLTLMAPVAKADADAQNDAKQPAVGSILDDLVIDPQQDYVTLVTCTPYGVNSHRLLIRGHRVDNLPGTVKVLADAVQVRPYLVAVTLAVPAIVLFGVSVFLGTERDIRYQRRWKAAREGLRERMRRRSGK